MIGQLNGIGVPACAAVPASGGDAAPVCVGCVAGTAEALHPLPARSRIQLPGPPPFGCVQGVGCVVGCVDFDGAETATGAGAGVGGMAAIGVPAGKINPRCVHNFSVEAGRAPSARVDGCVL